MVLAAACRGGGRGIPAAGGWQAVNAPLKGEQLTTTLLGQLVNH
jgi:hypothetical protein